MNAWQMVATSIKHQTAHFIGFACFTNGCDGAARYQHGICALCALKAEIARGW